MKKVPIAMPPRCTPWAEKEEAELLKCHALGMSNPQIYERIPSRSAGSIDAKMRSLRLERNVIVERKKWVTAGVEKPIVSDPWAVKLKFEDVTPTEARRISAGTRSAKFHIERSYSIYGSSMADMVA